jgi:acetylornithine deacetylase/succinyl-diaminopimelate desuccinylase-like protein
VPVPDPFARQHGMRDVVNLVARRVFGGGRGPTVVLHAPGDTVPPGEHWTVDPFAAEIRDDALYGRGAVESKSDIAAYAFAMRALSEAGGEGLAGTVELHVTFDEESGGFLGPQWLLAQGARRPDFAIGAGWTHQVIVGQGGCLHLEVVLRGKQSHASRPDEGRDAIAAAVPVLAALYAERDRLRRAPEGQRATLSIGTIDGGTSTNLIADRLQLTLDRSILWDEDAAAIEAGLIELIGAAAAAGEGIEVECRRILLAEPLRPTPESQRLAEVLQASAREVLGEDIPALAAPVVSGARFYAEAGISTVLYGVGPPTIGEGDAHGVNEHVSLADLAAATRVVARTLQRLLSA